jgi:hypothetical protein
MWWDHGWTKARMVGLSYRTRGSDFLKQGGVTMENRGYHRDQIGRVCKTSRHSRLELLEFPFAQQAVSQLSQLSHGEGI